MHVYLLCKYHQIDQIEWRAENPTGCLSNQIRWFQLTFFLLHCYFFFILQNGDELISFNFSLFD